MPQPATIIAFIRQRLGPIVAAMAILAVLSTVVPAGAHVLPAERTLVVQVSEDRVEILVEYLQPPGPQIELLVRRFDLNHDHRLRGPEAKLAGTQWLPRVLRGLQFEVVGESPRARPPEIKFRREQRGALTSAVYARWDVDPLAADQTRTVRVRLLRVPDNIDTQVTFQSSDTTTIVGIDRPDAMGRPPARPMLRAGQQISVKLRRDGPSDK